MKKFFKIVGFLFLGFIVFPTVVGIIMYMNSDEYTESTLNAEAVEVERPSYYGKTYEEMTRFERKKWFDDYTASQPPQVEHKMLDYIRSKYNYPETVKFTDGNFSGINKMMPIDWDKGIFACIGEASAENAFKQRSKSQWFIHVQLSDSSWRVVDFGIQQ
jgi:hypothetical protein